jgi:citronellol/citronellal dehydrogenase
MAGLEGKVALVTGSSRGIGKVIALTLDAEGADIAVCARSEEGTADMPGSIGETAALIQAMGRKAIAVKLDVVDDESCRQAVARVLREFGRIDILVNNAASVVTTPFLEGNMDALERSWLANVRAPFFISQLVAPEMVKAGGGTLISISSGAARNPAPPGTAPTGRRFQQGPEYGITKAALDRMTTGLASDLYEHNIAAVSVYPGFTATERLRIRGLDLTGAEQPETTAKAVAHICKDPMTYTGRIVVARELVESAGL